MLIFPMVKNKKGDEIPHRPNRALLLIIHFY